MEKLFLQVLNMSITSCYVIIFMVAVRLLLKKCPKIFSYALWSIVLFRLVCPFSFESIFSLLPFNSQVVSSDIIDSQQPGIIPAPINAVDIAVNHFTSVPLETGANDNPKQIWLIIGELIWIVGIVLLLSYSIFSTVKVVKKLKYAQHSSKNIYITKDFTSAFVFGIISPKIFLPEYITQREQEYILLHEQKHIQRLDHIIKPLAFLVLCIHWFNPFVWVVFFLMGEDMEMSCDESVIKQLGNGIKREYSSSLLSLSTGKKIIGGSPLAFGENNTKSRIKNVLTYKKPTFWVLFITVIAVVIIAVGLLTNPKSSKSNNLPIVNHKTKEYEHTEKESDETITPTVNVNDIITDLFDEMMKESLASSNPYDYVKENPAMFNEIVSYGNNALLYCFHLFEQGEQTDLKGHLMMYVCRAIQSEAQNDLGYHTGQLWYESFKEDALKLRESYSMEEIEKHYPTYFVLLVLLEEDFKSVTSEIILPDFSYSGDDDITKTVYETEINQAYRFKNGFLVPAVKIHGSYKEQNKLKVFATIYNDIYKLYGKKVKSVAGNVVPVAITYTINDDGDYILEKYEQAMDGSKFMPSIKQFCTYPVSGKKIIGIADNIIKHYSNYEDLRELQTSNLIEHLNTHNQTGVSIVTDYDDSISLLN